MLNRLLLDYVKKVSIQEIITYYDIKISKGYMNCPFHDEKTPSAKVYEDSNTGYCFGCHKLFDGIELVKHFEKTDFEKAVQFIYEKFSKVIFNNKVEKKNIILFLKLNNELRDLIKIVGEDKDKRMKISAIMQIIDLNAENNLLILKLYQTLLEQIK